MVQKSSIFYVESKSEKVFGARALPLALHTFEYEPKFADKLSEWDEYPLVYAMEFKKNNLIGANVHYIRTTNARLKALNNKRFPKKTLRQYIPKRADSLFFEINESEVQLLSTLPLEKFHYNR